MVSDLGTYGDTLFSCESFVGQNLKNFDKNKKTNIVLQVRGANKWK